MRALLNRLLGNAPPPPAHTGLQRRLEAGTQELSLRRLRSYGLQSVQVIDALALEQILREATDEALRRRGVVLDPGEREEVLDFGRSRLAQLERENSRLAGAQEELEARRGALERELTDLRLRLSELSAHLAGRNAAQPSAAPAAQSAPPPAAESAAQPSAVRARPAAPPPPDTRDRLRAHLRELLREGALGEAAGDPAQLEAALERAIAAALERAHEEAEGEARKEADQLARRLAKLGKALEEKERALRALAQAKQVDTGVASIYGSVQGLATNDPDRERKGALLADIFRQNVALQLNPQQKDEEVSR
ncbi:MAG: hypothetical protein AB7N76_01145 [Planctomycetota bacterium]